MQYLAYGEHLAMVLSGLRGARWKLDVCKIGSPLECMVGAPGEVLYTTTAGSPLVALQRFDNWLRWNWVCQHQDPKAQPLCRHAEEKSRLVEELLDQLGR